MHFQAHLITQAVKKNHSRPLLKWRYRSELQALTGEARAAVSEASRNQLFGPAGDKTRGQQDRYTSASQKLDAATRQVTTHSLSCNLS